MVSTWVVDSDLIDEVVESIGIPGMLELGAGVGSKIGEGK